MQGDLLLSDIIDRALQEISKLGLCSELNCQYRRVYDRLKDFAKNRNTDCYSAHLLDCLALPASVWVKLRSLTRSWA